MLSRKAAMILLNCARVVQYGGIRTIDIADGSRQHAAPGHRLANADAGALAQGKWLACAPVFDEFDSGNQAGLPDVADVGQLPECFNSSRRTVSSFCRARMDFSLCKISRLASEAAAPSWLPV